MGIPSSMRFLFALPGFHSEERGAEIALLAVADELARLGHAVTVLGSGPARASTAYAYRRVAMIGRRKLEWLPTFPPFRSETAWEDATFAANLLRAYRPGDFDVSVTCNYPFTNWVLRRGGRHRPRHIFVTQNGDWPACSDASEYRWFGCDGLVCTNPDYRDRNRVRWHTALIPNGINPARFRDVNGDRARFGLPASGPVVLMVSALIETKRVADGIRAVASVPGAHLVVAGDGPLRGPIDDLAGTLLPGRFTRLSVPGAVMPTLYRSADAFLHMSFAESFGNVYVEAMAAGLPIVANNDARVRWIVGDRDTLCDVADLGAAAAALSRALARGAGPYDPRADRFGWPEIARQYANFAATMASGHD